MNHLPRSFALLVALAVLPACGTRTPERDNVCNPERPKAYSKPPSWKSCREIRTNESRVDPQTGNVEHHIHNHIYCCP